MAQKITKDMTVAEAIAVNPAAADVLVGEGLGCGSCMLSGFETIEEGALGHGINPDELLEELNREEEQDT